MERERKNPRRDTKRSPRLRRNYSHPRTSCTQDDNGKPWGEKKGSEKK